MGIENGMQLGQMPVPFECNQRMCHMRLTIAAAFATGRILNQNQNIQHTALGDLAGFFVYWLEW